MFLGILEVSQGFLEKLGGVPRILVDVNYSSLSFVKYMYCLLIKHRIENIGNLSTTIKLNKFSCKPAETKCYVFVKHCTLAMYIYAS